MMKFLHITVITFLYLLNVYLISGHNILGNIPDKKTFREEQDVLKSALEDGMVILFESEFISRARPASDNSATNDNLSSEEHSNDNNLEKIDDKKRNELRKDAKVMSEVILKRREGELSTIPKKDGTLHIMWKLIFYILYSRSGKWLFNNPSDMNLKDAKPGHHKVLKSTPAHIDNNIPLPEQQIYSISNIPEVLPEKNGKTPILLFGMEAFVIFHLINQAMLEIVNSSDPIEEKVLFSEQWVHFVKHHFFIFFPYNAITSKRCVRLLSDNTLESEMELLDVCKSLAEKSEKSDLLETFIMIDPENNGDLLEKCINEKHIIPSYMKLNHEKLSHLHLKHNLAMELSDFISTYGMIMTNAEQEIFKDNNILNSKFWGAKCTKDEAIKAENEIIKLFSNIQKDLNGVITKTFQKLLDLLEKNGGNIKSGPAKSLIKAENNEFQAAKKECESNNELKKNIEEAKTQFLKYAADGSSGGEELVKELANNELSEWKFNVSAHILDTMNKTCEEDSAFCLSAIKHCRKSLEGLESDTEQYKIIEKLHRALSAALLKSGKLNEKDYIEELSGYIKHDQNELSTDKPQQSSMLQIRMARIRRHKI